MRKPSLGRDRAIEFNMTPMIDVVFLLIIFFLASSQLASREAPVALKLPAAEGREASPSRGDVTINVLADGRVLWEAMPAGAETLLQQLVSARREHAAVHVRIRADRRAEYGAVEPVLAACAEAGVWNVQFAVLGEQ